VPWIRTVDPSVATGLLKTIYDTAVVRAGKVFNVIRLQSLRPKVLQASTHLYVELMHAPDGALDRLRRELIAVVVSRTNGCHY
jgi:alkylhydroperoxidase family enzyme